jgi:hypothetical protein
MGPFENLVTPYSVQRWERAAGFRRDHELNCVDLSSRSIPVNNTPRTCIHNRVNGWLIGFDLPTFEVKEYGEVKFLFSSFLLFRPVFV